jgi:hypothetical protein
MPSQPWSPDQPDILRVLAEAEVEESALLASGSNYVFLLKMHHANVGSGYAVYKPQRGEAPLMDFPDGTLYAREYAAYLVSEAVGWHLVPPTVVRSAGLSHGVGALQLFIEHDPAQHYFTLRDSRVDEMKRVAVFDWLTNNADRKGGHCIIARDGRLWCIDQGLTFHYDDKLRTVIWDFQGQPVPEYLIDEVCEFGMKLRADEELRQKLLQLISTAELSRLEQRVRMIDSMRVFPPPPPWRPYPWPMI